MSIFEIFVDFTTIHAMAIDTSNYIDTSPSNDSSQRARAIGAFLQFLQDARSRLKTELVCQDTPEIAQIRAPIEEHYVDDQGKPAMYLRFESALYDDAQSIVTLWSYFDDYQREKLRGFRRLAALEIEGLTGDRHPRKVFDRSPFGIAALVVGTITIWMSVLKTYTGEDLSELLELVRFNWLAGTLWIVGLFVVLWYILKTHRNNCQVAFLSSIARALDLYLEERS